jgi:hypothetical protein
MYRWKWVAVVCLMVTAFCLTGCKTTDVRREAYRGQVEMKFEKHYCVLEGDRLILTLSQQRRLRVMPFPIGGHILTVEFKGEPVIEKQYTVPSDLINVVVWPGDTTELQGPVISDVRGSIIVRAIDKRVVKTMLSLSAPGSDWKAIGQVRFKRGPTETRRPCHSKSAGG